MGQTLKQIAVYYDRMRRHEEPDHEELVLQRNGHEVRLVEGYWQHDVWHTNCPRCGRTHLAYWDILLIDGNPIIIEEYHDDNADDWFPASQAFQIATGWYPYQFRELCEKLATTGIETYEAVMIQTRFDPEPFGSFPGERAVLIDLAHTHSRYELERRPFTRYRR